MLLSLWGSPAPAAEASADCRPQGPLQSASLKRVVDGDSIAVRNGEPLRLIGINTPELGRGDDPDEPGAVEAHQALRELLAGRQRVWLAQDRERYDRYGRQLAHVYTDPAEPPVAAQLLRRGLGWRVAVPPNLALQDCLAAAEDEARRHHRGLWALPSEPDSLASSQPVPVAELHSAGFARVDLTIRSAVTTRDGWWLETDGSLVLRLDRSDLVYFTEPQGSAIPDSMAADSLGMEPESWQGQRWLVRGWVIDRSASEAARRGHAPLLLRLRHPSMIERRISPGEGAPRR